MQMCESEWASDGEVPQARACWISWRLCKEATLARTQWVKGKWQMRSERETRGPDHVGPYRPWEKLSFTRNVMGTFEEFWTEVLHGLNWCFWTVVLEKTLESPLDYKEIRPVHPKGDQSWVFIGRTDAEAETPVLWPPHSKSWLIWKDPDSGKDWGQEEKGTTEDEMAGWHHQLDGHEFE